MKKVESAIASNNTASIQALQNPFDTKISEIQKQLTEFNNDKTNKFNELKQTRSQIEAFINANKTNQNYADLIAKLTNAKKAKESVSESSNKSDIIAANDELKQALQTAQSAKTEADRTNGDAKAKLSTSLTTAKELVKKLVDSDGKIQQAKTQLNQEIKKVESAIASNNTASIQALQNPFDTKISEIQKQLTEFNNDKTNKFNELKQTRSQIEAFINANKTNQNYADLIAKLTNAKKAKESVSESSNKSDIIAANDELKQALQTAQSAKTEADRTNGDAKAKLSTSLTTAKELVKKLVDSDGKIQQAKTQLNQEIKKVESAIASNNTASIQALQNPFDTKISEIQKQLTEFNNDKTNKFNELKQTRSQIEAFINANKTNQNYADLIAKLTNAKKAKESVSESSNKSDIIAANDELKQALQTAQSAKTEADRTNGDAKAKLSTSLTTAKELVKKLVDSDGKIQQAKTQLNQEIKKVESAIASNNTASIQALQNPFDTKISEIQKQLTEFNNDKTNKFNELKQTRSQIEAFINANKTNQNYADLIAKLTNAKKAKESVSESSNKSDIIAANDELKQALQTAQSAKTEADRTNGDAKAKLSTSLTTAKELVKKLVDSDGKIQQAKTQLNQEIKKVESAIASNNTASIQALQNPFDTKISEIQKQLTEFNNDKTNKFNELKQTRSQIEAFINANKTNQNYADLIAKLTNAKKAKESVSESSNKSDIIAANDELKQALQTAQSAKTEADRTNGDAKAKLSTSLTTAKELVKKLVDSDGKIQQAKTQLNQEIKKVESAIASNNTASIQALQNPFDTKISEIQKQLTEFNNDKTNKFNELKQTRSQIEAFINANKTNQNYADLIAKLTNAKKAKESVSESSNKSDIIAANDELKQALQTAQSAKTEADRTNGDAKAKLSTSLTTAKELVKKLVDSDGKIQQAKTQLNQEIKKVESAIASNNTASIQALQNPFDTKISEIQKQLTEFNNDKTNKFNELKQTRSQIEAFINANKTNQNYADLIAKLTNAKKAKESVSESSNKSDIIAANDELKQALQTAQSAKTEADRTNGDAKAKLSTSLTTAKELVKKLVDSDGKIQQAKTQLNQEIKKVESAIASNNTASIQALQNPFDTKISEIQKQLTEFNNDKTNKFNELKQTRSQIEAFINANKTNQNYADLIAKLTNAKKAKESVSESSNKSDIIAANDELKQALQTAQSAKTEADRTNGDAKAKLSTSLTTAKELVKKLVDSDGKIQQAKTQLNQEIKKVESAIASNNTASIQALQNPFDTKISEIQKQLTEFNNDKTNKFNELKQTRSQIEAFINANKTNQNYADLIAKLTNAKKAKESVSESSNKSDIIAANDELKQALQTAQSAKTEADRTNGDAKAKLSTSLTTAKELVKKLVDSDGKIQQAKTQLNQEIKKVESAIASNNTASIQALQNPFDTKISEIQKQLTEFNNDKTNKFNELKQTRSQIEAFINANKTNQNYADLIAKLTNAKKAKESVSESSNKSDIIAANDELKQALQTAQSAKTEADRTNGDAKAKLSTSLTTAKELVKKLVDSDGKIQQAKTQLNQEIKKVESAIASNNTASIQALQNPFDTKISEIQKQLTEFNNDKTNKFNELKQTRSQIEAFINANKTNQNYADLIAKLTNAKKAKESVSESSNKSDIIAANDELKQALQTAQSAKTEADRTNGDAKAKLSTSLTTAKELVKKLVDSDGKIQQAKTQLNQEIKKVESAIASNNTASIQALQNPFDTKIFEIQKQLTEFNNDKTNKFNELKQTRSQIEAFINANKTNQNYADLIAKLTNAKKAKESVSESSNKSDIIAANDELKQALQTAQSAKTEADRTNGDAKAKLSTSLTTAKELVKKLVDSDGKIQQAKTQLNQEIKKVESAIASNNTASIQALQNPFDTKISEIQKQLTEFNNDKTNKFNELKQTRSQIEAFINANKTNQNYADLIAKLTNAKKAKESVSESSNKSDIIAANQALQQALNTAKAKKSSIDNELKPLKDDLQSKIDEFGSIRNTDFSWISSRLETTKNKLAEELTKADAIKNNPSSSKQALKDSSQQVQKLGSELLKTITEEFGKVETKNSNIGYRLFKLAQAEQFNNSDVDKLKNAWEEKQTLLSKKQKLGNQSTKDYLTQLSTEMSTQESTIKKVIVNIQAHIRNNLNSQYRLEADKLIANMKRGYGDKVGIESLQKWQDLMDDSVLSVDDSLKDDFNKALRVLVGDYTKNPPVSSWFINKRNRSIENYQNLRNLILVRENEILLDKAKDLDKRAEKTIKFVDENINSLDQRAKTLKQEILNAKNDLSNFTLNHQKNQFTAKDITPKISLLENKLNEINQYLLPIIKQKAQSKISEIEKNKKELEDIIRSNFYLWEKNEINKYISELTNKQVELRSNINFENKWESIKDTLDNLNIKENVSLLKEVIINNSNAQYSINRILSTVPEFIKVAQTTRSNNLRSLSEQFKFTLLNIDKDLKEVKKILDENKTLSRENITKLNEKIKLFVDRSRELKESLRWFDNFHENISDQRIKNKLDEVRELLKNV
ncbi:hypothetical protein LCMPGD_01345 [Metamycoplasma hominis]